VPRGCDTPTAIGPALGGADGFGLTMHVIGLMSGTSADGIDAALVEIGTGARLPAVRLLRFEIVPFPGALRERILRAADGSPGSAELCRLNAYLGELFAQAARLVARRAGVPMRDVALIGSHGQTIAHLPAPRRDGAVRVRSTLQIGEPSIIAERTGVTTVADFRPRDLAAGGEGAPLTPYLHALLFRHPRRNRIVLNLGGIANLTFLPRGRGLRGVLGFDTGPGNVLIDGVVSRLTSRALRCDLNGRIASSGRVEPRLLRWLLSHPYLRRRPPKSTGRSTFGPVLVERLLRRAAGCNVPEADIVATVTAFTAASVTLHIRRDLPRSGAPGADVIVCGGGASNPFLLKCLQDSLPEYCLLTADDAGFPSRAIEASTFALLACLTARGVPGNLPAITGAAQPVVLGKVVPGRTFRGFR
jgi:anhydro-N-acetylmuramic acid kinase